MFPIIYRVNIVEAVQKWVCLTLLFFSVVVQGGVSDPTVNKSKFLSRLLAAPLKATKQSMQLSESVIDLQIEPGKTYALEGFLEGQKLNDKFIRIRVRAAHVQRISVKVVGLKKDGQKFKIILEDKFKRKLAYCSQNCKSEIGASGNLTQIFRLRIHADNAALPFKSLRVRAEGKGTAPPVEIPRMDIKLTKQAHWRLRQLTKIAQKASQQGGFLSPKRVTRGEIEFRLGRSQVSMVLSGRGGGHFEYPPSLHVKVLEGNLLFGNREFKLQKFSEKSGLFDLVARTIASDMGLSVPPDQFVHLYINQKYEGIYLLEPYYGAAYFEGLSLNQGKILGFDPKDYFRQYPHSVDLVTKVFFPTGIRTDVDIASEKFVSQIDRDSFAKFLAFIMLMQAGHGIGIDDLRFIEDPITGRFDPILRDLDVAIPSLHLIDPVRSIASHQNWLYQRRLPGIGSTKPIEPLTFKRNSYGQSRPFHLFFWDVHPSVLQFIHSVERRGLVERKYLQLLNSSYLQIFKERFTATVSTFEREFSKDLRSYQLLKLQWQQLNHVAPLKKTASYVKNILSNTSPLLMKRNDTSAILFNPYPLSLHLDIVSQRVKATCSQGNKGYLSPNWNALNFQPPTRSDIELISELFSEGQGTRASPICILQSQSTMNSIQWKRALHLSLSDGTAIIPSWKGEEKMFHLPKRTREIPSAIGSPKSLVQHWDSWVTPGEVVRIYAIHRNREGKGEEDPTGWLSFDNIKLRSKVIPKKTEKMSLKLLQQRDPVSKGLIEMPFSVGKLLSSPISLFGSYSVLLKYVFERTREWQHLKLNKEQTRANLGSSSHSKTWIFESRDFIIPALENPLRRVNLRNFSDSGIKRVVIKARTTLRIDEVYEIPENQTVVVEAGVQFKMGKGAGIIVKGQIELNGTAEQPIEFLPIDLDWGGIIIDSPRDHKFSHVNFFNAAGLETEFYRPFGGITLLKGSLMAEFCKLEHFQSEDTINVYRGELHLSNSRITDSQGDGIDVDFSEGKITHTVIEGSGGDGIDLNQSHFLISHNTIRNNRDKGLSIGERSIAKINDNKLIKNYLAIAIKDQSLTQLGSNYFQMNRSRVERYNKKPWYGATN